MRKSGSLHGSNASAPDELALLWFSAHQQWEPTATKLVLTSTGQVLALTFAQQVQQLGCIRFGLPACDARLIPWATACKVAGTPYELQIALEQSGLERGANPAHWFACTTEIPLAELSLEIWADGWRAVSVDDAPTRLLDGNAR